jgi:hypothetical protein
MRVIQFTKAAADPHKSFGSPAASFLLLADGNGNCHINCLQLEMNGKVESPSITHGIRRLWW